MNSRNIQKVNINSESDMPPIKKKDFFELINNNDDAYNQKIDELIKCKAKLQIEEKKNKAIENLLEKERREKELLVSKNNNRSAKMDKTSSEYTELLKKSKDKREYMNKNMDKLIDDEIKKNMMDEIEQFEKKHGVKLL